VRRISKRKLKEKMEKAEIKMEKGNENYMKISIGRRNDYMD
jgi:hypothetical protein